MSYSTTGNQVGTSPSAFVFAAELKKCLWMTIFENMQQSLLHIIVNTINDKGQIVI